MNENQIQLNEYMSDTPKVVLTATFAITLVIAKSSIIRNIINITNRKYIDRDSDEAKLLLKEVLKYRKKAVFNTTNVVSVLLDLVNYKLRGINNVSFSIDDADALSILGIDDHLKETLAIVDDNLDILKNAYKAFSKLQGL